jgi:hypothetical protein
VQVSEQIPEQAVGTTDSKLTAGEDADAIDKAILNTA